MSRGKRNRQRGFEFEREVVNTARRLGFIARRAYASNGQSLGVHESVDCIVGDYKIQCKRKKAVADYIRLSPEFDLVVFREDKGRACVVMDYERFLKLIK